MEELEKFEDVGIRRRNERKWSSEEGLAETVVARFLQENPRASIQVFFPELVMSEIVDSIIALTSKDRQLLLGNLTNHFNLSEVNEVIFLLGLDKDNFSLEKNERIVELIETCQRQMLLGDLLAICEQKRPFLSWKLESFPD